jgi:dehydrogenase/reductase SDR family protein 7B
VFVNLSSWYVCEMTVRFEGQNVWITGASSGIGEALAREFASRGARVLLSARNRGELERVAKSIGERASVLPLDLEDVGSLAEKAEAALALMGHIDVMVHNGGISQRSLAADTSLSVVERLMRVNFLGAVGLTLALLPSMRARRGGHFVVVTSLVGVFGTPLRSGYSASKHALHGYFDSLRAEHAKDGLGVTIVCPGFINTNVSKSALTADGSPQGSMDVATGDGMNAADCAREIVRGTAKRKTELYVGGKETLGVYVKRASPALFAKLIARVKVT